MVVSAAEAKTARNWANDLERLRLGLSVLVPVTVERLAPVVVVVFPDEKAFRPYKLLQKGKPAAIGGYFARSDTVNVIGLAEGLGTGGTRRLIFHEGTHWFLSAGDEKLPLWIEEGMAELFSTFMADRTNFMVGDSILEHVDYLRRTRLPTFPELFAAARGGLDFADENRTGRFYAGAWLFLHWVNFGKNSPGPASLRQYLEALKTAGDAETAFTASFGGNYEAVSKRLVSYVGRGKYVRRTFPLPAGFEGAPAARPSTTAEIEFALGSLLLASHGPAEALPRLRRAAELAPENPRTWEALAAAEFGVGRHAEALVAYDRATKAGSRAAMIWNNRAALRQETEQPAGGWLSTADRESFLAAATDYRRAIELDPRCQPAYLGLAGVTYGVEPFDPEDVARFEQGRRIFPDDVAIALGHALALLRSSEGAAGEIELRRLLEDNARLPGQLRRLGENALELEKLKVLSVHVEHYNRERRYAELVTEVDQVLGDNWVSAANRRMLLSMRKQADQMRRMNHAVELLNAGAYGEGEKILRGVLEEGPADATIRSEAQRLLRFSDAQAESSAG